MLPMIFVGYELAVEQTQEDGVGDSLSCGIINVTCNFISFVITLSITPLVNQETDQSNLITFIILFINLGLATVFLIFGNIFANKDARHTNKK